MSLQPEALACLETMAMRHIELRAEGGRILFRPAGRVSEQDREQIRALKPQILHFLAPGPLDLVLLTMCAILPPGDAQDLRHTSEGRATFPDQIPFLHEPSFEPGAGKPSAGVLVEKADGRIWVIHSTNQFGGFKATFPKGRVQDCVNLQASAIREAFEESERQVEITCFLRAPPMSRFAFHP